MNGERSGPMDRIKRNLRLERDADHIKPPIFKFDLKMKSRTGNTVSDGNKLAADWHKLTAGYYCMSSLSISD
jgi:hypothetical protein